MSKIKIKLKLLKKDGNKKSYWLFINKQYVFYYEVKKGDAVLTDDKYYLLTSFLEALDPTFGKESLNEDEFFGCDGSPSSRQYLYNRAHEMMMNKYFVKERGIKP